MIKDIKTSILNNCDTIVLKSKLSNHNIIYMRFMRSGRVFDMDENTISWYPKQYFNHNSYNWWVGLYIGPQWKRLISRDDRCYGSTVYPLEGLIAGRKLIQYFIDHHMGVTDVLEVSGSTRQRDEVYYRVLSKMGFRYTPMYCDTSNIMIYVKDNGAPEHLDNYVLNLDNPWGSMRYNGVIFPEEPDWQDDYNPSSMLAGYIYHYTQPITDWLRDVQSDIKRLFKKNPLNKKTLILKTSIKTPYLLIFSLPNRRSRLDLHNYKARSRSLRKIEILKFFEV